MEDYTIEKINSAKNIYNGDYILYNGNIYKIDCKKYSFVGKINYAILLKCINVFNENIDVIKFDIIVPSNKNKINNYELKTEIDKVIFNIKVAPIVDYNKNENLIIFLDNSTIIEHKYIVAIDDNLCDQSLKYIKFNDVYKIIEIIKN